MILLEYPVAFILKAWHWLLANTLGVDATTAWLYSIPLLVITVRGFLLPLMYRQLRSSRRLASVRIELRMLTMHYLQRRDKASQKELRARRREIYDRVGYKVSDGCLPIFILFPILIGLYRLLLHISHPAEGLEASHHGYGPLSGEDITQFLDVRFFGVPLPAYKAMNDQHLAALGTHPDAMLRVTLPLIFLASLFTTANLLYSIRRNSQTMDYAIPLTHLVRKFMWWMVPVVLLFPWIFGLFGPAPLAILIYWVCNNLWTATQNFGLQRLLDRTHPYSAEFLADVEQQKLRYRAYMRQQRPHILRSRMVMAMLIATLCGAGGVAVFSLSASGGQHHTTDGTDNNGDADISSIATTGQCITWDVDAANTNSNFRLVDCDEQHRFEIAAPYDLMNSPATELWSQATDSTQPDMQQQKEFCTAPTRSYLRGHLDPVGRYTVSPMLAPAGVWSETKDTLLCGVIVPDEEGNATLAEGRAAEQDQSRVFAPDTCIRVLDEKRNEVPCTQTHDWQATATVNLGEHFGNDAWPSTVEQNIYLDTTCTSEASKYLGGDAALSGSGRSVYWTVLEQESWSAGSRIVNCGLSSS